MFSYVKLSTGRQFLPIAWRQDSEKPNARWTTCGPQGVSTIREPVETKVKVKSLSGVQLFATPWTAAHQAPPPMGFSRQKYWSGVPLVESFHFFYKFLISVSIFLGIPWVGSTSLCTVESWTNYWYMLKIFLKDLTNQGDKKILDLRPQPQPSKLLPGKHLATLCYWHIALASWNMHLVHFNSIL